MTNIPDAPSPLPAVRVRDGLFVLLIDDAMGRLLLGLRADQLSQPFLLSGGLQTGVGASELPLDRGYPGVARAVQFTRAGETVYLEYPAAAFGSGNPAVTRSGAATAVDDAFARSIGFATSIVSPQELAVLTERADAVLPDDLIFIDVTEFVLSDVHDLGGRLHPGIHPYPTLSDGVPYVLDPRRSFVDTERSTSFAANTELVGTVTFATTHRPPAALTTVSADARQITVSQRISLVALATGFRPRSYHPASGGWRLGFDDPSRIGTESTEVSFQPRFRIDNAPIVFSVDPGIPEPYLAAVLEGGSWWSEGFSAAGHHGAFRVEVRAADTDPWDITTNTLWWVHRSGRGWSMGHSISDPFTGEIFRGSVRLGSQRVTQLRTLFEALTSPYGRDDETARLAAIEDAVVQRIRQLAAHEIGHALGFQHNFVSTWHPKPSVMDYPYPRIRLDDDGEIDLSNVYAHGLGPWDVFLVRHAYENAGADVTEADLLRGLRAGVASLGYLLDPDGHSPRATSPRSVPWTLPHDPELPDSFDALAHILRVRATGLANFDGKAAPASAQAGELENRLSLVYLLHRFELQAVARLVGGADYSYGRAGEQPLVGAITPGETQQRALDAVVGLLSAEVLTLPSSVLAVLSPPAIGYDRGAANFATRTGAVFDRSSAIETAVALVADELLATGRLNRLLEQSTIDASVPTPGEVVARLLAAGADADALTTAAVRHTTAKFALHRLASGELSAATSEAVRSALGRAKKSDDKALARFIRHGLKLVDSATLAQHPSYVLPTVPQGVPL